MTNQKPSIVGAIFLVSGTSVGAGMLAQPVAASLIGFIPSTLMMFVAWAFMTSTALILLEVSLWMKQDSHIISMASQILGPTGKWVAWIIYLFIAYLSLAAYISGGGDIFKVAISNFTSVLLPDWLICSLFVFVFGIVIELGTKTVGKLNTILFCGLVVSYIFIISLGAPGIKADNLLQANFDHAYFILPLFLTSFSFQMIVPSLATYLNRDRSRLRLAILIGTSLSFLIYLLWNIVVLGHLSIGTGSDLAAAYAKGSPPISVLGGSSEQAWFGTAIQIFAFFALVTSFIGLAWGLFDFLADGFAIKKAGKNRIGLWLLVMFPPLLLALSYPRGFIGALETTGGFGDTILNGILPVLMFWIGCYKYKKLSESYFLKNRTYLCLLVLFAFLVIALEAIHQFHIF